MAKDKLIEVLEISNKLSEAVVGLYKAVEYEVLQKNELDDAELESIILGINKRIHCLELDLKYLEAAIFILKNKREPDSI
jgi:hypothetical protein